MMHNLKLDRLAAQAMKANSEKRYADESKLWARISRELPNRYDILCNLASAKMNEGQFEEAFTLFEKVLKADPSLSRAHNNFAGLKLRMGADIRDLLPEFLRALELSQSSKEFCWHSINLCQSAAFGSDEGAPELLDTLEQRLIELIDERFSPSLRESQRVFFGQFVAAYRLVANYRQALVHRDWRGAERSLKDAQHAFVSAGLQNFADGIETTLKDLYTCKDVFALLEDIAGNSKLDPEGAYIRASSLQQHVGSMTAANLASPQKRLFDVLSTFLVMFSSQLRYLSSPESEFETIDHKRQGLMWLTGSSFRLMGDDLLGIINFTEKRCRQLSEAVVHLASNAGIRQAALDSWAKLALYIHGRLLDFRGVDSALARASLGWADDPLGRARAEVQEFRAFIERQAYGDILVGGKPQENIGRALLQARLTGRSYREVPVRGGRSDILAFEHDGRRVLFETKIWRGAGNHEQGIRELSEYVGGEGDDGQLLAAFYIVFDPTESARAIEHEGSPISTRQVGGVSIEIVVVRLRPPVPSRIE